MLKKIYILLFSLLIGFFTFAQIVNYPAKKIEIQHGFSANYFTNSELNFKSHNHFSTNFSLSKSNQIFSIGTIFGSTKNDNLNFFKGGIFSYQYFPNKTNKRFNFYFIYDFIYTFEKSGWEREMQFSGNNEHVTFNSPWHSLKNQVGYGFNVNIYKGFYLTQSMSIGIEYYNFVSKTVVKNQPQLSSTYSSGNIFSGSGTSSLLKLGMGYHFKK
ncbi:MAG: hypothetical protein SGJ10_03430 [Bacteroidota bacterium]|nr:hypothetical protein [Bacteroidota bacterium]